MAKMIEVEWVFGDQVFIKELLPGYELANEGRVPAVINLRLGQVPTS